MKENKEFSLEEALKNLEEIVAQLESKDLELEKALSLYEEGVKLIQLCENYLKEAKLRVEVILKEGDLFILEEDLEKAKEKIKNGKI